MITFVLIVLLFMTSFSNKIVVITGASSGIGKALLVAALQRGAKVAVCSRNIDALQTDFATNDHVFCYKADVSKEEECKAFIDTVIAKWGAIDVLINNAGISMRALFAATDISVIRELMDVNFWGMIYCTHFAIHSIMEQKGVIVGVSSIAGYRGLPCRTGYSASKFAMQGFLESLRTELLHSGTHVMWVSPGFTASNIRNTARSADGTAQKETPLKEEKLMTAEECATIILDGVEKRKRSIVMTTQGKLTVWLNKLFPSFADRMVYKHFLNEPDSPMRKGV